VTDDVKRLDELLPDPHNPRAHGERNLAMIGDSLQALGPTRSIVIDETDTVLAGNGVVEAARKAGKIKRVLVIEGDDDTLVAVRRRGLTAEQKRQLPYYDNRAGELATWAGEQVVRDM
jgi:hypothetical protein